MSHEQYHYVAQSEEVSEGQSLPFTVNDIRIAVIRHEGQLYALDDRCPHADATMAFGLVGNGCIACPWHFAEFDLKTGEVLSGPATEGIQAHRIRERDGVIEVAFCAREKED